MLEEHRASQQTAPQLRTASSSPRPVRARRFETDGQCLIKGNHSRRGDWIYHLPGMPFIEANRAEANFIYQG